MDLIDRNHLKKEIETLKESPWYKQKGEDIIGLERYKAREDAVDMIERVCINTEPEIMAPNYAMGYQDGIKAAGIKDIGQANEMADRLDQLASTKVFNLSIETKEALRFAIATLRRGGTA